MRSFLDTDFYKITMGNLIFGDPELAEAIVTFRLKCRTPNVKLGLVIPENHLREELDSAMNLRPTSTEIYCLRGMDIYGDRMLSEEYLKFLKNIQLTPYDLTYTEDGDINLEFTGPMKIVTYWELFGLPIVNELYHRYAVKRAFPSQIARDAYLMSGMIRFLEKVKILTNNPNIYFSDFATRRRASGEWHDDIVEMLAQTLPRQFRGTSNVYLAMKHNLIPMGTSAHELNMVTAGLADIASDGDRDAIRASQNKVINNWWNKYGYGLSVLLPDTYGSKFTFESTPKDVAAQWKGTRQDSGDTYRYGEKAIQWHARHGANPAEKMIVFSDGLRIDDMLPLERHFRGRIATTFGWGTSLTNDYEPRPDLGLIPLSLVIKPVSVNGQGLVKLSDNIAKAIGNPEDIKRYKQIFDYDEKYFQPCTY